MQWVRTPRSIKVKNAAGDPCQVTVDRKFRRSTESHVAILGDPPSDWSKDPRRIPSFFPCGVKSELIIRCEALKKMYRAGETLAFRDPLFESLIGGFDRVVFGLECHSLSLL
jgi:hypothetical protein